MRTLTNLLAIGLLSFTALHAQESNMSSTVKASEMYADGFSKFRFGGYGEMAASYMDYDWNWVTPQGTSHMNRATVSIPRFILAFDYKFSPMLLSSEIEFEYGGTRTPHGKWSGTRRMENMRPRSRKVARSLGAVPYLLSDEQAFKLPFWTYDRTGRLDQRTS